MPVLISQKVVLVLYGDNQVSGFPIKSMEFLQKLARKMAMSWEVIILKKKIQEI